MLYLLEDTRATLFPVYADFLTSNKIVLCPVACVLVYVSSLGKADVVLSRLSVCVFLYLVDLWTVSHLLRSVS